MDETFGDYREWLKKILKGRVLPCSSKVESAMPHAEKANDSAEVASHTIKKVR
jgi:hypothetical protein